MKTFFNIAFIFIIVYCSSCKKTMEPAIVEKQLGDFDTLVVNSVFNVYLIQGMENSIRLEGSKKIVDDVSYTIVNNSLVLKNNYKGNWVHPEHNKINIYLTIKKLRKILVSETCNIQTKNTLQADILDLGVEGKLNEVTLDVNCRAFVYWNNFPAGGKIQVSGNTYELRVVNEGLMSVDAHDLKSSIAYVENSSKGDCQVTTQQTFSYKISGEGNIILSGKPAVIINEGQSSKGVLITQ